MVNLTSRPYSSLTRLLRWNMQLRARSKVILTFVTARIPRVEHLLFNLFPYTPFHSIQSNLETSSYRNIK